MFYSIFLLHNFLTFLAVYYIPTIRLIRVEYYKIIGAAFLYTLDLHHLQVELTPLAECACVLLCVLISRVLNTKLYKQLFLLKLGMCTVTGYIRSDLIFPPTQELRTTLVLSFQQLALITLE